MEHDENVLRYIDAYEIQKYQQNRYTLFFADKITEALPGKYAKGYQNFPYNEWYFPAHFEDEPNVPGFIQIETLTQVFLIAFLTIAGYKGQKTGFVSVKNANFKKKIVPGDRMDIVADLSSFKRGLAQGVAIGYVNNEVACSIELVIAIPDVMLNYRPGSKRENG